ncbi:chemotaxis protein MotA [Natronocella acetinitrilica]|uniref:Chemotaxis protein MotA n=1 Tax=Natronocella acetinitrilica TaxID=414046 RepID=A0AAE3G0R4_9GAMM|nr:MotA/TolQ/ExbB proton channel family protein [Natronocella acetinitrilica]MCP1673350.1 chemotaxis protein MotA [Natronocella acetinitrilica]
MNPSTVIGMVAGVILLATVLVFAVDQPATFINLPGLAIVVVGTLAATFISYPLREVVRVVRLVTIVMRNENTYSRDDMEELVQISRMWFRDDLRAVERALERTGNPFLRTGVQLVIDGTNEHDILDLLRWRIARLKAKEHAEAQIFRTMAAYAPAFGMIGTLVGLINMLYVLEEGDIAVIAQNMGIALLTTFYGILLANLIFKPFAVKLERRTEERLISMNMVLEGVALISQKRNPAFIQETLRSFMAQYQDEIRQAPAAVRNLAREKR